MFPNYIFIIVVILMFFSIMKSSLICNNFVRRKRRDKSGQGKVTDATPVSLPEVKVTLPSKVIFGDKSVAKKYDPSELAQLPKVRLGEGTLGSLFKVVLDCGSTVTMRKIREDLVNKAAFESRIRFFGWIRDTWLLPMHFSFWYGGETFILYEYMCLGSLEELLHGSEGIQFTPLSWSSRKKIALCAAKAVAFLHSHFNANGALICGVIKSSNIMIQLDFSACLSSYETPYLLSPAIIIRRNLGRVAPELRRHMHYRGTKVFTRKSDVYSFGILLLELITGKKPSVTNLEEYVKEQKQEGLRGICDNKLNEVKEDMDKMVQIAESCLVRNPRGRPSMDSVVQDLQELQD